MFKTRLISSIVLVVLALVVILTGGYLLAAVLLFLSLTAYRELMKACGLTEKGKPSGLEIIGYTGIVAYYLVMVFTKQEEEMLLLVLIMILIAFMFLYVLTFPKFHADQIMSSFFNVVYAPVMLSCIYLVRTLPYGNYSVWMIFISSWICDTCAYAVGIVIGKHKMVPKLSPKKSRRSHWRCPWCRDRRRALWVLRGRAGDHGAECDMGLCIDQCSRCSDLPDRGSGCFRD